MKTAHGRITMFAVLLSLFLAGAAQATPTVDLGTASGSPGSQVIISVTLTNDGIAPVAGVATDIGYNSEFLTPVSVAVGPAGTAAGKSAASNIVSPGLYRVGIFSSANVTNIGNGVVANVTFAINSSAPATSYELTNDPSASTATGGAIDAIGNNGTITVGAAVTTTTTALRVPVEHIKSCNKCHPSAYDSTLSLAYHSHPSHVSDCTQCHDGTPGLGTVILRPSKTCATCHPQGNIGICNLTTLTAHSGENCLSCHVDCDTSATNNHMTSCLTCHPTTAGTGLHTISSHTPCSICHPNNVYSKNVTADKCVVCHPIGNAGACNLVDLHDPGKGASCLNCHMNCAGGSLSTTTTSVSGGSSTTSTGGGSTTTSTGGGSTTTSIPGTVTSTTVPSTSSVPPNTHTGACLTCHFVSDIHSRPAHNNCANCHIGTPGPGTVSAGACVVCHPLGNPGQCNLVNFHGSTCNSCHTQTMCPGGATTTTVPGQSSSTTTVPSTTSTIPNTHTGKCLACHLVDDLHAHSGHNNCSYCHREGTDSVQASSCAVCHPLGSPGKCGIVKSHGGDCLTCHANCVSNVTTTITGSSTTTTGGASTTTTVATPSDHFSICLTCHYSSDLHDHVGHGTCSTCHSGTPAKGNVGADKCIACHPLGAAGKCNLINGHGGTCLTCHANCTGGVTTTTVPNQSTSTTIAGQTSTTTAPPNYGHIGDCTGCHPVSDLHAGSGHGNCSQCHDGTPQAGNVSPGNCVKCHPLSSPGKCNLIVNHGSSCLTCHESCAGNITTTTTIPNPPPTCTLTVDPISVRSGLFIPHFARIRIQTEDGTFDGTSAVSIQGFHYIRTTLITASEIDVLVVVPPEFLIGMGNKIVTVLTGNQICTGTIAVQ